MKKIFYLFLMIFGIQSGSTAQSQWSFGPKIGLGISDVSVTGIDHNSRTGVTAGLFGEYRIQNFALEADFYMRTRVSNGIRMLLKRTIC